MDREYERESLGREHLPPFSTWLRQRCAHMVVGEDNDLREVCAMSYQPSRRVCSFRSMKSYGSHYRVEGDEATEDHVTYDCGVAELEARREGGSPYDLATVVLISRVGTLRDILVFDYRDLNVVLMVVSWVAKDTEMQPRLQRDSHGFWIANMDARPRCNAHPCILPLQASQVTRVRSVPILFITRCECRSCNMSFLSNPSHAHVQVFFVPDKAHPGWSVVLHKEARGRRITSTGVDLILGQEESSGDRDVFTMMAGERRKEGDENDVFDAGHARRRGDRTRDSNNVFNPS